MKITSWAKAKKKKNTEKETLHHDNSGMHPRGVSIFPAASQCLPRSCNWSRLSWHSFLPAVKICSLLFYPSPCFPRAGGGAHSVPIHTPCQVCTTAAFGLFRVFPGTLITCFALWCLHEMRSGFKECSGEGRGASSHLEKVTLNGHLRHNLYVSMWIFFSLTMKVV